MERPQVLVGVAVVLLLLLLVSLWTGQGDTTLTNKMNELQQSVGDASRRSAQNAKSNTITLEELKGLSEKLDKVSAGLQGEVKSASEDLKSTLSKAIANVAKPAAAPAPPPPAAAAGGDSQPPPASNQRPICGIPYKHAAKEERISACSEEGYYMALMRATIPNHDWTVVDVGINKGFILGSIAHALGRDRDRGNKGIATGAVEFAKENGVEATFNEMCGTCKNCMEPDQKEGDNSAVKSVTFYGFDIIPDHIKFAKKHWDGVFDKLDVRTAGMSNRSGEIKGFCLPKFGFTRGRVDDKKKEECPGGEADIPLVTLDEALSDVPYIDFLVTDTEGNDWLVADGAKKFLSEGRVGMYQFETHIDASGDGRGLRRLLDVLEPAGYACFFPMSKTILEPSPLRQFVEITGACWQLYETTPVLGWHNVVCVHNRHQALLRLFRELGYATSVDVSKFV